MFNTVHARSRLQFTVTFEKTSEDRFHCTLVTTCAHTSYTLEKELSYVHTNSHDSEAGLLEMTA